MIERSKLNYHIKIFANFETYHLPTKKMLNGCWTTVCSSKEVIAFFEGAKRYASTVDLNKIIFFYEEFKFKNLKTALRNLRNSLKDNKDPIWKLVNGKITKVGVSQQHRDC